MQTGPNKVNPDPSFCCNLKRRRARAKRQGTSTQTKTSHKKDARCLITGDSAAESPVHLCYVLNERRWINHFMLPHLEWIWGMKYDTLKLDTQSNAICLREDWRESLESDQWMLFPR
ncbi:hypothetical protein HETIRDRAFT_162955 [Heterobasidion irregulare TC 32-1]|uniref:HNH nuclease domain-containing protein n=1 Tax=Heterobasidion irregulare (strain TC 32-1) TaxID=747525 RepID=W4JRN4_HETIT|nr:uncharacterized protein HETIRDRAFT_162955 [Heterobasidion irregulare TC 32-1]ETW76198.1 hypothetical protein HETIRDRAFT_162955 [Heterobasidion irregulare TC 32-1]